jgi:hypothetical protein
MPKTDEISEFLSPMKRTLERNMLKFQVGQAIFCPGCKSVMDCRRAVGLDWHDDATDELKGSRVVCASCFDAKLSNGRIERQSAGPGLHVKVQDGRVLFGRRVSGVEASQTRA